jgi:excinuclease ABC subunit A
MPVADIVIRGAREHNLRGIDLSLPRNKLIVMTGVSGSGKSSLAFDTLYAEGQRRYVESLSTYARQFLGQMPKPDVDSISGLAPSISIQQKATSRNPRSTVGTITEVYDYLRVLYARVGQGSCVACGRPIAAQSIDQILESILTLPEGTKYQILAPMVQQQKGEFRDFLADLLRQGYLRARVDGELVSLSDNLGLKKHFKHTIEVVVDRLVAGKGTRTRLAEAIEQSVKLSGGTLIVSTTPGAPEGPSGTGTGPEAARRRGPAPRPSDERLYSTRYACAACGISYEPASPQLFSFNSPLGMCTACTGLGQRHEFLIDRLVADPGRSLSQGALHLVGSLRQMGRWRRHILRGVARAIEQDCGLEEDAFLKTPWNELPEPARALFLDGLGDRLITFAWRHAGGVWKHGGHWKGLFPELHEEFVRGTNPMRRRQLEKFMQVGVCSACGGSRLNPQARHVTLRSQAPPSADLLPLTRPGSRGGRTQRRPAPSDEPHHWTLSLPEVCALSIRDAARFFEALELDNTHALIAEDALREIRGRLAFLQKCGLDYLSLDRSAPTLSGGESQRIRLAGQIGCGLVGVLYILDEPSIGLHPRDNALLLESLQSLRDQGNTVVVVEHDEETIRAADHIVDFGPGPGIRGGEIVAEGTFGEIAQAPRSLTGAYLTGRRTIPVPAERRPCTRHRLKIVGARHNNLQHVDVDLPLGVFVCVTGVSGSGKSSLCNDILWEVLNREVNGGTGRPGAHDQISGLQALDKAIDIDQSPIGRTPRSNPATYVKLLDEIRRLYTQLPQAKVRGYKPGRFSFNVPGGRCEACEGHGATRLEMDFLADIWVPCGVCSGKRFNHETLEVRYRDRSIADVLDMDVQEALEQFANHPVILRLLQTLHDVGLDYLKLGQPSPTLSGGEAQRIKLARELGKRSTGKTLYLLDEPTTGLHFEDVRKLLEVLHGFVEQGNTVLVIEHNLDVVKTADWIIDLGPEGGGGGGTVVATGTPEQVAEVEASHTGRALRAVLQGRPSATAPEPRPSRRGRGKAPALRAARDPAHESITIRGASQHNLQSVNLTIPRDRMSVFCGPSGSGKTSLAMDTLYAEGQRRYVESLSAYARQFLGQMPKPKLEHISGLSPAIAIEQKTVGATPRSTVGTVTEIFDYLRVLYTRLGHRHCPDCGAPVTRQTTDQIIDRVLTLPDAARVYIAAPVHVPVGQSFEKLWERLSSQGFLRVRIDGVSHLLEEVPAIDHKRAHDVEVVVDRIKVDRETRGRLADSVEAALDVGRGVLHVVHVDRDLPEERWRVDRLSVHYACPVCPPTTRALEELSPQSFSFNSPLGWCPACEGLGIEQGTNQQVLVASPSLSLAEGAVTAWPDPRRSPLFRAFLEALAGEYGIPLDVPWYQLDSQQQRIILYGAERPVTVRWSSGDERTPAVLRVTYKGLYPAIDEASRIAYDYRLRLQDLVGEKPCQVCGGDRMRADAAAVRLQEVTLPQLCRMPLSEAHPFLLTLRLTAGQRKIAGELLQEAVHRLGFLVDVGLDYLTLDRGMPTLSGGESQRIRLAGQIGRALTGVLYVLDEPTIGLHPRDNGRLIQALHKLRDLGNTVVLVEHDREVLEASDRLYDFGPGSGRFGGTVVAEGAPRDLARSPQGSLTGAYLSGEKGIPVPRVRRMLPQSSGSASGGPSDGQNGQPDGSSPPGGGWLALTNCRQHNLRGVDLRIPLGTLTCVTGLSGSGKSSLIFETLARAVARHLHRQGDPPGPFDELTGVELISRVITVDQQPLGATPASNPATYTGVFDPIRELFSKLPDAKVRGYKPGRFSFNRAGGRCEDCEGLGQRKIEMHFLPDVWVDCDTCRGRRYSEETLVVRYRGHSIADVLNLSIAQGLDLFDNIPRIRAPLATLAAIGLDYLTLGQSAATLSGGEAQRVKLAAELCKPNSGRTLYLLDEPTTGLHFDDIVKLLKVLGSLVEQGNTVIVIEHNLDVIKTADWVIDLGPEAGSRGGNIVAQGTPEDVAEAAQRFARLKRPSRRRADGTSPDEAVFRSWTGELLAPLLAAEDRGEIELFDAASVARKRTGDLDIAKVGRDIPMPWQVDGRQWHTQGRPARNGATCKWEGAALSYVVDLIEEYDGLQPANWNDASTVEITAAAKAGTGWFFHALTGDEWLLRLYFRVPRNSIDVAQLAEDLDLPSVDDMDDLPVYGRGERVRANSSKGPFQEIVFDVHTRREIDTPVFHRFIEQAVSCYLERVAAQERAAPAEVFPWKVLGRKWHLSRKGFPPNRRVAWSTDVLESLVTVLEQSLPDGRFDWTNKTIVTIRRAENDEPWGELQTKRRDGVYLTLLTQPGQVPLGSITTLGADREVTRHRSGAEAVRLRFDRPEQVRSDRLQQLLARLDTGSR